MNSEPDLNIELGPTATYDCPCCGKRSETVHGFLYKTDGSTSVYFAGYTPGHAERRANLVFSLGGWGDGTTPADRHAIALQATHEAGAMVFTFPPPESSPWFGKETLGTMRRPEELSGGDRECVLRLAGFAVTKDPRVALFFSSIQGNA